MLKLRIVPQAPKIILFLLVFLLQVPSPSFASSQTKSSSLVLAASARAVVDEAGNQRSAAILAFLTTDNLVHLEISFCDVNSKNDVLFPIYIAETPCASFIEEGPGSLQITPSKEIELKFDSAQLGLIELYLVSLGSQPLKSICSDETAAVAYAIESVTVANGVIGGKIGTHTVTEYGQCGHWARNASFQWVNS